MNRTPGQSNRARSQFGVCVCDDGCSVKCLNVQSNVECVSENCADSDSCQNRRFQRKMWKQVKVAAAGQKGLGLYANEDIECNSFVIEYVGEVIGEPERQKRMANDYANNKNFYIVQFHGGREADSIDATARGNVARFVNHSCAPNMRLDKWIVGDRECIGLFATKDILKGQELTFNYHWESGGLTETKCLCGFVTF